MVSTELLYDFIQVDFFFTTGVSEYSVSLEKQEVLVKGTIPYEDLLAKIKKTGKEVSFYLILMILNVQIILC